MEKQTITTTIVTTTSIPTPKNDEDDGDYCCSICSHFTTEKTILPCPCKCGIICQNCISKIDRCPFCRGDFHTYELDTKFNQKAKEYKDIVVEANDRLKIFDFSGQQYEYEQKIKSLEEENFELKSEKKELGDGISKITNLVIDQLATRPKFDKSSKIKTEEDFLTFSFGDSNNLYLIFSDIINVTAEQKSLKRKREDAQKERDKRRRINEQSFDNYTIDDMI